MVLANLNWLSKIGKAVIATKKPIIVNPLVDNPIYRFPKAEIAITEDVLAFLAKE
jgi:hypothetical protein